jgi:hypothetical protein
MHPDEFSAKFIRTGSSNLVSSLGNCVAATNGESNAMPPTNNEETTFVATESTTPTSVVADPNYSNAELLLSLNSQLAVESANNAANTASTTVVTEQAVTTEEEENNKPTQNIVDEDENNQSAVDDINSHSPRSATSSGTTGTSGTSDSSMLCNSPAGLIINESHHMNGGDDAECSIPVTISSLIDNAAQNGKNISLIRKYLPIKHKKNRFMMGFCTFFFSEMVH